MRKKLIIGLTSVLAFVVIAIGGAGWYFSSVIHADGLSIPEVLQEFTVQVVSVDADSIILEDLPGRAESGNLRHPSVWGLFAENGYGRLGAVISESGRQVEREFTLLAGEIAAGDEAYVDRSAFPHDPLDAHGLEYTNVTVDGELGPLPAWFIAGESDTWAILVHGWRSGRNDALRMLPVFAEMNIPSLVITYRNDEGVARDPSNMYQFGQMEWRDVESAVNYAVANGASDIVLVGFSMGGGTAANFMYESDWHDAVTALILDAPMLDFGRTVDLGAQERSVPGVITWAAKQFTTLRFDINWDRLNYLSRAGDLEPPILLFHGTEDTRVPKGTSDEFAAARPDIVQYEVFAGAQHVGGWNIDQARYEMLVRDFLTATVP